VFFVLEFFAGMPAPPLCCFNPPLRGYPRHASHCQPTNQPTNQPTDPREHHPALTPPTATPHHLLQQVARILSPSSTSLPGHARGLVSIYVVGLHSFRFVPAFPTHFLYFILTESPFLRTENLSNIRKYTRRGESKSLSRSPHPLPLSRYLSKTDRQSVSRRLGGVEQYHKHLLEQALWVTKSPLSAPHR
jgi:hypothetical protein